MNERDFYYWLQGFFELSGAKELNQRQVQIIKEHMELVSYKKTHTSMEDVEQNEKANTIKKQLLNDGVKTKYTNDYLNNFNNISKNLNENLDVVEEMKNLSKKNRVFIPRVSQRFC